MFRKTKGLFLSLLFLVAIFVVGCSEDKPAEKTRKIVVQGDTINSHFQADAVCVVDSRFERGHSLVFRANVIDEDTNKIVEDAKVKAILGTGEKFDMELGPHGEEGTLLYTALWTIPDDFPTGTLDYKIVAEVDGKEYSYEPFNVSLSKLTILEKGEEERIAKAAKENAAKEKNEKKE